MVTVKEFIEELSNFNPEAEIVNGYNFSWDDGLGESCGEWDDEAIMKSKESAKKVWIHDNDYGKELEG